ncbi:MAG: hypothetical protein M3Q46_05365 [Verrucomicrobiota bacterium]|nr:hypothetical protein [Verrucomicrobiota bacterium]
MRLPRKASSAGFSLVESSIAVAISVLFLSSVFMMNISALDSIRGSKESVAASQVLQQRIESLRIANWQQITSASWLAANSLNTSAAGTDVLKDLTETLILVSYGSTSVGNTQLVRNSSGTSVVNENAGLLTENAVKAIWTVTYNGAPNSRLVSRQIVAILAKGGVAK